MNQNLKDDIKEWLELIAVAAVSSLLVLHVNSMFSPKKETKSIKTEAVKPVVGNDTITQHVLKEARQLKR